MDEVLIDEVLIDEATIDETTIKEATVDAVHPSSRAFPAIFRDDGHDGLIQVNQRHSAPTSTAILSSATINRE